MSDHSMKRHLILRLEAPLIAFGGVTIDNYGFTRDFPARSMLTGLFANALGWQRGDRDAHQALQDRLIYAARRDREPFIGHLQDVQNARLEKNDKGWTTRGAPEGRAGASYGGPHRRFRDYHPDALLIIALRLAPADDKPHLDDLTHALDYPARPLFLGRKPCLPAAPLIGGVKTRFIEASTVGEALAQVPHKPDIAPQTQPLDFLRAIWPPDEAPSSRHEIDKTLSICDERNWRSGLHGGTRMLVEGRITRPAPSEEQPQGEGGT